MAAPEDDERFMRGALREARKGVGKTSPNPAVGAVLVFRNRIIARGYHRAAGEPHAEIECLSRVRGTIPNGAILYLTLEPCSSAGRTGPCTGAIIRSGIKTVVIGATDVNPRHAGRGLALMQKAGIKVRSGILEKECTSLNEAFNKWIVTGRPWVVAKCGMSLDGRISRPPGESRWITSVAARRHVHRLRAEIDAILIGAETLRADDPQLTVRGVAGARQPFRVILTRSGRLPKRARVFCDRFKERTLVYKKRSLSWVLADLGKRSVTSVLIEGGGEILGQALDNALIDKMQIYVGPVLTGGPVSAFAGKGASSTLGAARLENISYSNLGGSICVSGYPRFPISAIGE
ncbi:MAG: Riboflavin biosynthesis protein RibD [Spartobacteria bacterium]|nr:Riboflavin biosynthesis protein RibD [Spartobacteria bacterium]